MLWGCGEPHLQLHLCRRIQEGGRKEELQLPHPFHLQLPSSSLHWQSLPLSELPERKLKQCLGGCLESSPIVFISDFRTFYKQYCFGHIKRRASQSENSLVPLSQNAYFPHLSNWTGCVTRSLPDSVQRHSCRSICILACFTFLKKGHPGKQPNLVFTLLYMVDGFKRVVGFYTYIGDGSLLLF